MLSCSIHHWVLFFLSLTFTTVPTVSFTSVTARLHQSATLPCTYGCPGLVRWTVFPNPHYILVRCDQRACWSEKGYEMSHDQYLKGNLSLTITAVDYSKRAFYTCDCDGAEACEVHLMIDLLILPVQLNPGEALVMDLPIPEPVEVMYKSRDPDGSYSEQMCTVIGRLLQCKAEYTHRTSLRHTNLTLRDVKESDSGSYSIRDTKSNEVLHLYTVLVVQHNLMRDVMFVIFGMLLAAIIISGSLKALCATEQCQNLQLTNCYCAIHGTPPQQEENQNQDSSENCELKRFLPNNNECHCKIHMDPPST